MNLPIKLVDLVTLLFLSLLIVIIIFIILQRNIKRFKLRNIKDPHFVLCKSIPRDLREKITRKHIKSNIILDAPVLTTKNYENEPLNTDNSKSFVLRLRAYDTAFNLEYALNECGYKRHLGDRFEEFIEQLFEINDKSLPKDMLDQFYKLYVWCMIDPADFTIVQLRQMNRLINQIITL
jgi:hypothetical protein